MYSFAVTLLKKMWVGKGDPEDPRNPSGKPGSRGGASDGQPSRNWSLLPLEAAKVKRRRGGDKHHRQTDGGLLKSGGSKLTICKHFW